MRAGYKQTEVGVIPEDWEVKSVRESADIKTGPFGTLLKASEYSASEGVPLISVGEIGAGKFKVTKQTPLAPRAVVRRLPQYVLRTGDVVFGRKGAVERSALITESEDGWFLGSDGIAIRPRDACHPPYLAAQFQGQRVQLWLIQNAIGTTMASLNQQILGRVQFPLPPLPEQRAIAAALSDVDALLGGLDRLIAKKRDLKQAAMQQLLTGQTRLPGFSGEWEVKRLGDVGDIRSGGTPSTRQPQFWDGDVPWCTPTDITALGGHKYLTTTARTISAAGLQSSSAEVIPPRSLVMTSRATIGACAINLIPMTTNQGFKNIVPFAQMNIEFLYYLMTTQEKGLVALCGGSTFLEIGKKQLSAYEIMVPKDLAEQTAIAAVLSDMDAEIAALEARRDKIRALKQGMMQELLTGKTRLIARGDAEGAEKEKAPDRIEGASNGRPHANVHFRRAVLAAEIVERLYAEPTFGHVKFEKMIFLVEHLCQIDTGSSYHRDAAGPYDNRALRSIDSQLKKQLWFEAKKEGDRFRYAPLKNCGGHRTYFERYYAGIRERFDQVVNTFKSFTTERCEIVATLFAAWTDLIEQGGPVSDARIVHEVLHQWHESKKRISEDRWMKAINWMRENGIVPSGQRRAEVTEDARA